MNKRDLKMFDVAKCIAMLSTYDRNVKVGCIVTYHNRIISSGFNKNKSDTLQMRYNRYRGLSINTEHKMHAEICALKPILNNQKINWNHVHIYIYRLGYKGMGLARPCDACMSLIRDIGIHHVYYTTNDGYCYEYIE